MVDEQLREFLRAYIDSFECLEVLLLLRRERTAWTAEALCTRLNTRAPLVDDALTTLVRAGLLDIALQDMNLPTAYTYAGESSAHDAIVASLETAYRDERIRIMQLMSTNAIDRLRTSALRAFADAFIFRKDKDRR